MTDLTAEEKMLVTDLNRNPIFASLCRKSTPVVPKYRAKGEDEAKKVNDWIYRSGFYDGAASVLKTLGYDHDR